MPFSGIAMSAVGKCAAMPGAGGEQGSAVEGRAPRATTTDTLTTVRIGLLYRVGVRFGESKICGWLSEIQGVVARAVRSGDHQSVRGGDLAKTTLVTCLAFVWGCPQDIVALAPSGQVVPAPDAGRVGDAGALQTSSCESFSLPCLGPATNVIRVPDDLTMQAALSRAGPRQVIQVRGRVFEADFEVPSDVTVRGCSNSSIRSTVTFARGGTLEGFEVTGSVVVAGTGTYVIQRNRFTGPGDGFAISVVVNGVALDASLDVLIDRNRVGGRPFGVEVRTSLERTASRVTVQVQNNVFDQVVTAVEAAEVGASAINLNIVHNTFFDFSQAVVLTGIRERTGSEANVFAVGGTAFMGNAPYTTRHDVVSMTDVGWAPVNDGVFVEAPLPFVDSSQGDFRPTPEAYVVDRVAATASTPTVDHFGCPRPVAYGASQPFADIGAVEAQPW